VRLLAEELFHHFLDLGMRVMPPTSTTSPISPAVRPASSAPCGRFDGLLDEIVD